MTVCTNDVAFGDLGEDGLPGAVAQALRDVEALLSEMVELEDERVVSPQSTHGRSRKKAMRYAARSAATDRLQRSAFAM
jgi:hypothetical protein